MITPIITFEVVLVFDRFLYFIFLKFAQEWVNRERPHGWPSPADVARMTGDGVLLVAACHRSSRHPMDEWRVSFTQTERALIDTLSSVQRLKVENLFLNFSVFYDFVERKPTNNQCELEYNTASVGCTGHLSK